MVDKTLERRMAAVKARRGRNYRQSLRLEGVALPEIMHGSTKAEVIAYYRKKALKE